MSARGVKNAVMLYGRALAAHPEKSRKAPVAPPEDTQNVEAMHPPAFAEPAVDTEDHSDEAVLAHHEAWIAIEEGRTPRLDIRDAISGAVGLDFRRADSLRGLLRVPQEPIVAIPEPWWCNRYAYAPDCPEYNRLTQDNARMVP